MKVLTMCQGGNVRSAGCGFLLKYQYGIDALACSWEKNSPETLKMLFEWCDYIIVMQEEFQKFIPEEYKKKLCVVDVGPDVWGNSLHPDLLTKCNQLLQKYIRTVDINGNPVES